MMEIKTRTVVIIFISIAMYLWLTDKFNKPGVKEHIEKSIKPRLGGNATHTFIDMIEEKTHQLSGLIAISTGFILNLYPVRTLFTSQKILLHFSNMKEVVQNPQLIVYSTGAAIGGLILKKIGYITFGYYNAANGTNATNVTNSTSSS
jgi:hypothetical protein